jgi:hypothetical protein
VEETLRKHIYIARGHGFLQQINAADGSEVSAPERFIPPNGEAYAVSVVNGVVHTPTGRVAADF